MQKLDVPPVQYTNTLLFLRYRLSVLAARVNAAAYCTFAVDPATATITTTAAAVAAFHVSISTAITDQMHCSAASSAVAHTTTAALCHATTTATTTTTATGSATAVTATVIVGNVRHSSRLPTTALTVTPVFVSTLAVTAQPRVLGRYPIS
jgi:hypothetical protein